MILRIDKLAIELPMPAHPSPNSASAVQEALTGVDVGKLLPIPDISNKRFPEAKKHEAKGLHQVMYQLEARHWFEACQPQRHSDAWYAAALVSAADVLEPIVR